jgi:hypothetical protein
LAYPFPFVILSAAKNPRISLLPLPVFDTRAQPAPNPRPKNP